MEPNIKRRTLLGGLLAGGLLQGCGGGGGTGAPGSTPVIVAPDAPELPDNPLAQDGPGVAKVPVSSRPVPSLAALDGQPLYIAHRGAAAMYPEESYTAYDNCIRDGQLLLECDVYSLADDTTVVIHDETIDRTMVGSGRVASFTKSNWKNLLIDADDWHGSHFGNRLASVQFAAWVKRYKGLGVLIPEDKDQRSMSSMLAIFAAEGVRKDQVLVQCFAMSSVQKAMAAGYNACLLVYSGGPEAAVAAGVKWAGISYVIPDTDMRAWVQSGINVLVWTPARRFERDAKLALGVKGFYCDDPIYMSGNAPLYTTDKFDTATWVPGMLPNSGELNSAIRGKFMDGGYWGYEGVSNAYEGCLQGYLCPIKSQAEPTSYSVELNIRFGAVLNNDLSRWASVFIGTDDQRFVDKDEGCNGYHFLFRRNGTVEILRKTAGQLARQIAVRTGQAFNEGDESRFRIQVDGPTIKVSRLASDGAEAYSATVKDSTYRGAYLSLGRNGLACAFRRITIL
jgi:glycerophosphoryl diester phosphodiesterase